MVYISKRMRNVSDLFISDANFGMYKQDIEKAKIIVEMQKQYGYPKYIHVSTGKNQKERVIDIAKSSMELLVWLHLYNQQMQMY